jgi:transcriptional regulator with XRE-family HTH domain
MEARGNRTYLSTSGSSDTRHHRHVRHSNRPGIVAGAVLHSARLSADLSQEELATMTGVSEETIRAWEEGSSALASVPLPHVSALEASLMASGADPNLVADLGIAAWCDLVILAVAQHEDAACLMADPIAADPVFAELLAWCLTGHVPERHQPYAETGPLLTDPALTEQATKTLSSER